MSDEDIDSSEDEELFEEESDVVNDPESDEDAEDSRVEDEANDSDDIESEDDLTCKWKITEDGWVTGCGELSEISPDDDNPYCHLCTDFVEVVD